MDKSEGGDGDADGVGDGDGHQEQWSGVGLKLIFIFTWPGHLSVLLCMLFEVEQRGGAGGGLERLCLSTTCSRKTPLTLPH